MNQVHLGIKAFLDLLAKMGSRGIANTRLTIVCNAHPASLVHPERMDNPAHLDRPAILARMVNGERQGHLVRLVKRATKARPGIPARMAHMGSLAKVRI